MRLPPAFRRLVGGEGPRDEVERELRFHIEEREAELVRAGRSEEEARAEVRRRFGDLDAIRDRCERLTRQRMQREGRMRIVDAWWMDARRAARSLVRAKGFSAAVFLTLALGIGATTAVFSVVDGVLLRPLPWDDADELVIVWENDRATGTLREPASLADYYDYRERLTAVRSLGAWRRSVRNLTRSDGDPLQVDVLLATHDLREILGLDLAMGRGFDPDEGLPGGGAVALVSHDFWAGPLGGEPDILGSRIVLNDIPTTVIGVLAEGQDYPDPTTDLWLPVQARRAGASRDRHDVTLLGRLAPGTDVAAADAEARRVAADLEAEYPGSNTNRGAFVESLSDVMRGDVRETLWAVFAAVATVFLIACASVTSLFLARATSRVREVGVVTALGASRGEVARRFLLESLILTLLATGAGIGLAGLGVRWLLRLAPEELAVIGVSVDLRVLAFTGGLAVVSGFAFGLLPMLLARGLDLRTALGEGRGGDAGSSPARMRLRSALVAAQVALAVVLLTSAGLFLRTLANLHAVDPGFRPGHLLRMDYRLPESRYPVDFTTWPDNPERLAFTAEVVRRVEAVPGVVSAAVTTNHPLDAGFTNSFAVEDRPPVPDQGEMTTRLVSPGYFETVGLDLIEGRLPTPADDIDAPWVLVLNRTAAERYFPDGDALGQRITFFGPNFWREVVGIVEDERIHGLEEPAPPTMYASLLQAPATGRETLMVRTEGEPMATLPAIRRAFWSVDPDVPLFDVSTMERTLAEAVARERFAAIVLLVFAGVALTLSVLGVHSVLAYLVARRRGEVGIRLALGATPGRILATVALRGGVMVALGLAVGLVGAVAAGRAIEALLFRVSPTSASTYALVTAVLAGAAALGIVLPALRAARTPPSEALRQE